MRTTLTIDPDVAARLKRLRQRRDMRFKDAVNEALREGLRAMEEKPRTRPRSWTKPRRLGGSRIGSLDNIAEVLSIGEREAFK
ncbi:MAG: DUF2191 domain-containing protein [Alphaproteobacteria bacterium]|nr:DUF2191 domain-containing protein [Alphaproteobacteria bacterium]